MTRSDPPHPGTIEPAVATAVPLDDEPPQYGQVAGGGLNREDELAAAMAASAAGHEGGARGAAYRQRREHEHKQQAKASFSGETKGEGDLDPDLESALQASVADARQNSTAASNQDASLPYGGDLQAANHAQDRGAIRTIMKHQEKQRRSRDVSI